jgi:hypothetical protein
MKHELKTNQVGIHYVEQLLQLFNHNKERYM